MAEIFSERMAKKKIQNLKTFSIFLQQKSKKKPRKMASLLIFSSLPHQRKQIIFAPRPKSRPKALNFLCSAKNPKPRPAPDSESENALLKLAWYGSELLGIAVSFFRPPLEAGAPLQEPDGSWVDGSGPVDRTQVVETIKEDFQRSYFVTGNLTTNAYEENCEFADPAGSFRGLRRFKRNCSNFGSLLEKTDMKLTKWEDFEDRGIGHWRFSSVMSFPWRPVLSATGYTEYYFDPQSGRICRHVEHWNVPKMALLKQIFTPSRGDNI